MGKRGSGSGKKEKFEIKFDAEKRREHLTGFKKRKDERRRKYKLHVKEEEKKVKKENRDQKKAYRESINE